MWYNNSGQVKTATVRQLCYYEELNREPGANDQDGIRRCQMEVVGEYVDRLITVEMRPRNFPSRDLIRALYDFACKKLKVRSLTLLAAQKIIKSIKKNDNVFIVTGVANMPFLPHGETDGPLGAVSLARAINLGLDAKPLFVLAERDIESVRFTAKAAGLNVESYEIVAQARNMACIIPYPYGEEAAKKAAKELIDRYSPTAVFSFEVTGPNIKGELHSSLGFNQTERKPHLHHLFDEASSRGILTIAGLDGGNEIGSGVVEEQVRRVTPYGNVCQCPCKAGMACRVKTDVAIPASTSNWAAYGVSAMLGLLLGKPDLIQDADTEKRMLEASIMAGAVDGVSFRPIPVVDGTWAETNQGIVTILRNMIENGLIGEELKRLAERY